MITYSKQMKDMDNNILRNVMLFTNRHNNILIKKKEWAYVTKKIGSPLNYEKLYENV